MVYVGKNTDVSDKLWVFVDPADFITGEASHAGRRVDTFKGPVDDFLTCRRKNVEKLMEIDIPRGLRKK